MNKPEARAKLSIAKKGHLVTEETRRKIALSKKGRRLTDAERAQLDQLHKQFRERKWGNWSKFKDVTKEQVADWLNDWAKSHLALDAWAKEHGMGRPAATKLFTRFFPGEYADIVELKFDRKTTSYARGREFEWRVRDQHVREGYLVCRSPQSRGLFDLIAIKKGELKLIECRTNGGISKVQRFGLCVLAESVGADAYLARRGRAPYYPIILEKLTSKRDKAPVPTILS